MLRRVLFLVTIMLLEILLVLGLLEWLANIFANSDNLTRVEQMDGWEDK